MALGTPLAAERPSADVMVAQGAVRVVLTEYTEHWSDSESDGGGADEYGSSLVHSSCWS
jgi:hypothetical protein